MAADEKRLKQQEIDRRRALVTEALKALPPQQRQLAKAVEELECEILESEQSSGDKRSTWHWIARVGTAAAAVSSAGSGGALAAQLTGWGAVALGLSALLLGLGGAVAAGLGAEADYERNRAKSRAYEQLWWEIFLFATVELPTAPATQARAALIEFTRRRRDVGSP